MTPGARPSVAAVQHAVAADGARPGLWYTTVPSALEVTVAESLRIGHEFWFAWDAPVGSYSVIFEDDGDAGYLYAYDRSREDHPILDAVHIYTVENVIDRDKPSSVDVVWSSTGEQAALYLNALPHAVFDFAAKVGFCRTNFPNLANGWQREQWSDSVPSRYSLPELLR